ncbi:MAG: isoaspartyl peptidase/L-asparaginase [Candidatus Thorarchaeota archaeon]|jgi:beta-aspartyl-peptidase (threonine type)
MGLPLIVVHGGAGTWKDERIPIGIEHVEKAAVIGFQSLLSGGTVLDAAEMCTLYMESCGQLNAGCGATKNEQDERELDAMICDGTTLQFGSVASVRNIQNPISLARYVMEKSPYSIIAGEGAERIYSKMIEEGYREEIEYGIVKAPVVPDATDTVGCVVLDEKGRMAATSSTGGIKKKALGRVGDSPVFGAGAYANDIGVASATGYGEHIMRVLMSREVVRMIENGEDVQISADLVMEQFIKKTSSEAGLIVADAKGNWGKSTNAKAMPVAVIDTQIDSLKSFDR